MMNYRTLLSLLAFLGLGSSMFMPEEITENSLNAETESYMEESDDHSMWTSIGEVMNDYVSEDEPEDDEELLQDVSNPSILSDDICPDLLNVLNTMPEGFKNSLEDTPLDRKHSKQRCYRSRHHQCKNVRSLCPYPPYVVFGRYRYCCPNRGRPPIVQRQGRRIRCRCSKRFVKLDTIESNDA